MTENKNECCTPGGSFRGLRLDLRLVHLPPGVPEHLLGVVRHHQGLVVLALLPAVLDLVRLVVVWRKGFMNGMERLKNKEDSQLLNSCSDRIIVYRKSLCLLLSIARFYG